MKIAFCGASGTGKTTLAKYLAEELALPFNPVGSRSVAKSMGFDNPYDVDKADLFAYLHSIEIDGDAKRGALYAQSSWSTHWRTGQPTVRTLFQKRLQAAKIEWELEHPSGFVSDRTTVDDFAYLCLHNVHGVTEDYMRTARAHLGVYNIIFFTPVEVFCNLAGDSSRVADTAYHEAHQLLLEGTLTNWVGDGWGDVVYRIQNADLDARKEEVRMVLGV